MNFSLTSRRDDLISIGYILLFLLNNLQLPLLPLELVKPKEYHRNTLEVLNNVKSYKETQSMAAMLRSMPIFNKSDKESFNVTKIKNEIFEKLNSLIGLIEGLEFETQPNYA